MLEGILDLVKEQVVPAIANNENIPADKRSAVVETTTTTVVEGLKEYFTPDNISSITSLFSGEAGGSNIVSGLQNSVVNALSEKLGLNKDIANSIASAVIPAIMSLFSQKANDPNDESFTIESLIGALGGKSGGGLLGMLGGLFGNK
uniref:DUF937 domain-containing protein n=1 Tax=uncultured Dysgonomonas sp. TaxID=206096 RepID=UPI002607217C|nr:DUF937 domain-containing protein [uncultured Dysgonomonas sp.]